MKSILESFIEKEEVIELHTGKERMKVKKINTNVNEDISKTPHEKVLRAIKTSESCSNLQATKAIDNYNFGREISLQQVNMALFITAMTYEPISYEEALNCNKKRDLIAWKEAIDNE